ncbi:MAG: hypothetical protein SFU27_03605, partial [Thermonemataceae bacterium]|nr:hypothetical protein [Thermonemataceae bacterium]
MKKVFLISVFYVCSFLVLYAQNPVFKEGLKFNFNEDGSNYLKMNFIGQIWLRYNENNPNTIFNNKETANTFDIGLRRIRFIMQGYIKNNVYLFLQFGQNNLSYLNERKAGSFFHDANIDYYFIPQKFALGTGLASWGGVARYSAPTVSGIVTMDAPIYQQFTSDINDQFLRRLSVYTHGNLGKFSYRLALSKPMDVSKSADFKGIQPNATFAPQNTYLMSHGYFKYYIFEKDAEETGYHVGTYFGKKKIFTIGAGFAYEPQALWKQESNKDTTYTDLKIFAADAFLELPLSEKGNAINIYGAFFSNDYGKNYVRNVGVMNPANKVGSQASFNGAGNAFPMQGTGTSYYLQALYFFKNKGEDKGRIAPYTQLFYANYEAVKDPIIVYDIGLNYFIKENLHKISLNYQN